MVTQADVADVWVGNEGMLFPVAPDPSSWPAIHAAWDRVMPFVASESPPPLAKGDVRERVDPEWVAAAAAYVDAKRAAEAGTKALEAAKAQLIGLASHTSESGGVSVTRFWKSGAVDYKKIPELGALDLEQNRGPQRQKVRVTVA